MSKSSSHIPIRTCIACQSKKVKFSLLRIVQSKDKTCEIDFSQTKNGRGLYICPNKKCMQIGTQRLSHYRKQIYLSPKQQNDLRNKVESLIQKNKIYSLVGLARKAGKVEIGHTGVEIAIKKRQASLVIIAEDTSDNTQKKFEFNADKNNIKWFNMGNKTDWGKVFGRKEAAVFAILHQGFARAIEKELKNKE